MSVQPARTDIHASSVRFGVVPDGCAVPVTSGERNLLNAAKLRSMLQHACGVANASFAVEAWRAKAAELLLPDEWTNASLVFVGDSTMRNVFYFMSMLLEDFKPVSSRGWLVAPGLATYACEGRLGRTTLRLWLATAHLHHIAVQDAAAAILTLGHTSRSPPHAVVFSSSGLHLLHLEPWRSWNTVAIEAYRSLEGHLEAAVGTLREALPCARLAYITTNAVCEERFTGGYATAAASHQATERACLDRLATFPRWLEDIKGSGELCADGNATLTRHGTHLLNLRERAALRPFEPGGLAVIDAFELTNGQCWATARNDGRHDSPLLPARLDMLLVALSQPQLTPQRC